MTASTAQPEFLVARPNLHVGDIERSVAFYRDVLGFDVEAIMGEPPFFALLRQGGAEIALVREEAPRPTGCYIYVSGVEALHDRSVDAGVRIANPLTAQPWGLLDFVVEDPDGHKIAIGERKGPR